MVSLPEVYPPQGGAGLAVESRALGHLAPEKKLVHVDELALACLQLCLSNLTAVQSFQWR